MRHRASVPCNNTHANQGRGSLELGVLITYAITFVTLELNGAATIYETQSYQSAVKNRCWVARANLNRGPLHTCCSSQRCSLRS